MSGYAGGRIVRIKMKDFMTYDEMELRPKLGLNLVIGLNGSGKSSIMCAICLGLAGKPQYTGKSAQLSDFIKHGKDKATIEIELESSRGRNAVITRVFRNEKSTWLLNGSVVPQTEVIKLIKDYNIDLSNLCQFLPQEKVVEFSKMDRKQRLENMFQAIGEPHLSTLFEELKELRKTYCSIHEKVLGLQNSKQVELQKNERMKAEVEKHEERKRMEEELTKYKLQRKFNLYEMEKNQLKDLAKELTQLKRKNCKALDELKELKAKNVVIEKEYNKHLQEVQKLGKTTSTATQKIYELSSMLENLQEQTNCAKMEYRDRISEKENQNERLKELEKQIMALRDLDKNSEALQYEVKIKNEEHRKAHEKMKEEISVLDTEMEGLKLQHNNCEYTRKGIICKIAELKNEQKKKLELLKQRSEDAYKAVCWLQENISSFKSTICMPALLSMKVEDDDNRKYIENHINIRDLLAFVCEDESDFVRMTSILRRKMKLAINIILAPRNKMSDFSSPTITEELKGIGVQCFLKDLFDAPEPVVRTLCKMNAIHRVPICNNKALSNSNAVLRHFKKFFAANQCFAGTTSRYGKRNISVRIDHIRSRNILPSSRDYSNELQILQRQQQEAEANILEINSNFNDLQNRRTDLEKSQESLRKEKNTLLLKEKSIQSVQIQLRQKAEQYNRKQGNLIDEKALESRVTNEIHNIKQSKMEVVSQISESLKYFTTQKMEKMIEYLNEKMCQKEFLSFQEELEEKESEYKASNETQVQKQSEKDNRKAKAKSLYEEIKKEIETVGTSAFRETLNRNMEEVERMIAQIEAQLDLNCDKNDAVITEYQQREKAILNTAEEIQKREEQLHELKVEIEEKKQQWLPPLQTHVTNINRKFAHYFKQLQFAGEINLHVDEDPDDFHKYGLMLRLKYRNDADFQELSTHHSGGERSVAAIIFILSLQELTRVPFRCIDEINQGMDPINERKIHDLIANAAQNDSHTQYFLLTPKLLKDLEYHKDVAVHIIYNSVFLDTQLNLKNHLAIETDS